MDGKPYNNRYAYVSSAWDVNDDSMSEYFWILVSSGETGKINDHQRISELSIVKEVVETNEGL